MTVPEILEAIIHQIVQTSSVSLGFDKVMGEGAYQKLAGELYDELNAKQ
jgi:hypothetical protein